MVDTVKLSVDIKRPFRAELSDEERLRLKTFIYNEEEPLEDRGECALTLGWKVEYQSRTSSKITTHTKLRFVIYGYRDDMSKAGTGL